MCDRGGVAKCRIVATIRMVECTGGAVSFFKNICGDKKSFYSQVFLLYTVRRLTWKRSVFFSTKKNAFTSLGISKHHCHSQHESAQHNKLATRRAVGFMLYRALNEMNCQD